MNTFDLRPTARLLATPVVGLLFLSFCATAFTQNVADPAARKRPSVTRTPINLSPRTQLILDPTFEAGDPWPDWTTQTGTEFGTPLCDLATCGDGGGSAPPFAGNNWAWFGGFPAPQIETLGQVVTIPNGVDCVAHLSNANRCGLFAVYRYANGPDRWHDSANIHRTCDARSRLYPAHV